MPYVRVAERVVCIVDINVEITWESLIRKGATGNSPCF